MLISDEHKKKKTQHEETANFFTTKHCQAFYILEQTAVDYSVIILTILIMWLYCYNVTSHGKLNQISSYVITSPHVGLTAT